GRLLSSDGQGSPEGQVGTTAPEAGLRRGSYRCRTSSLSLVMVSHECFFVGAKDVSSEDGEQEPSIFFCPPGPLKPATGNNWASHQQQPLCGTVYPMLGRS